MLILDALRGEDSTGVAVMHASGDISVVKEVGDPFILLQTKRFNRAMAGANKALIGHNRWATTGKINRDNAHPFEAGDLVGVHNGTLKNKYQIPGQGLYDTDSEALYNHIDNVGLEDAIKIVEGAWCLVWYNKEDNSINFLRNDQRPMYIATSEDNKTIFWASEQWMITVAVSRNSAGGKIKIKELPVDKWYKYILPVAGAVLPAPIIQTIKGKETLPEKKAIGGIPIQTSQPETGHGTKGTTGITSSTGRLVELYATKIKVGNNGNYFCCLYEVNSNNIGEEYRVYGTYEELYKLLVGRWSGLVNYTVTVNGKVQYHKIDYATLTKVIVKRDHNNVPLYKVNFESKHKRCCNCHSKLEYDEEWLMLDAENVLCEVCNSQDIINLLKATV